MGLRASSFSTHQWTTSPAKMEDLREPLSKQNEVSLLLAKHLISDEAKDSNWVFSPLSINMVSGLIAAGSKGAAQDQLLSFLQSKSSSDLNFLFSQLVTKVLAGGSPDGGPRLCFANGVWVDRSLPLKLSFKKIVADDYKAVSNQVDFQNKPVEVTKEVNSWAKKGTNGFIKEILPPGSVDNTTRIIFGNALYYKGTWDEKFDASKTKNYKFHLLNGSSIQVPFMTSKKKQFLSAYNGFKVLCLPYNPGVDKRRFSMYFFLPDAKNGLPALLDKVNSEPGFFLRCLPPSQVAVGNLLIPKFKISFGFEASKLLKRLGVVLPFSGEGLTEIVNSNMISPNLYVSSIFHKSFVEVNEEGTEAAGATAGVMMAKSLNVGFPKLDFVADHPFLFLIREGISGALLFIGCVLNPAVS